MATVTLSNPPKFISTIGATGDLVKHPVGNRGYAIEIFIDPSWITLSDADDMKIKGVTVNLLYRYNTVDILKNNVGDDYTTLTSSDYNGPYLKTLYEEPHELELGYDDHNMNRGWRFKKNTTDGNLGGNSGNPRRGIGLYNLLDSVVSNFEVSIRSLTFHLDDGWGNTEDYTFTPTGTNVIDVTDGRNLDYYFRKDTKTISGETYTFIHHVTGTIFPADLPKYKPGAKLRMDYKATGYWVDSNDEEVTNESLKSQLNSDGTNRKMHGYIYNAWQAYYRGYVTGGGLYDYPSIIWDVNLYNLIGCGALTEIEYGSGLNGPSEITVGYPLYETQVNAYSVQELDREVLVKKEYDIGINGGSTFPMCSVVSGTVSNSLPGKVQFVYFETEQVDSSTASVLNGGTITLDFGKENPDFNATVNEETLEALNPFSMKSLITNQGETIISSMPIFLPNMQIQNMMTFESQGLYRIDTSNIDDYLTFPDYGFDNGLEDIQIFRRSPNDVERTFDQSHGVDYYEAVDPLIGRPGSLTVGCYFIDKRGVRTEHIFVENYNLQQYQAPTISSFVAERCREDGTIDDEGTYVKCTGEWQFFQQGYDEKLDAKRCSSNSNIDISPANQILMGPLKSGETVIFGNNSVQPEDAHTVRLTIYDIFRGVATTTDVVDQTYNTVDYLAGGKGITFGGNAEEEGFWCHMPAHFTGDVNLTGAPQFTNTSLDVTKDFITNTQTGEKEPIKVFTVTEDGKVEIARVQSTLDSDGIIQTNTRIKVIEMDPNIINNGVSGEQNLVGAISLNANAVIEKEARGSSWKWGRDLALIRTTKPEAGITDGAFYPGISLRSKNGTFMIGTLASSSYPDRMVVKYLSDSGYASGANATGEFSLMTTAAYPVGMSTSYANSGGYYGFVWESDGSALSNYLRTSPSGFIPYSSNAATTTYLGTSSWPFTYVYAKGIYLNGVSVATTNDLVRANNLLASPVSYMGSGETANLNQTISSQRNGIVLVWSKYSGGAVNSDFNCFYIPKGFVVNYPGAGVAFPCTTSTGGTWGYKYCYINNASIAGNAVGTANTNNKFWVLRAVYGV